jgi:hypothetical protein
MNTPTPLAIYCLHLLRLKFSEGSPFGLGAVGVLLHSVAAAFYGWLRIESYNETLSVNKNLRRKIVPQGIIASHLFH